MLAVKTYPEAYIDACEARMKKQLTAYKALADSNGTANKFEAQFFAHLTLVLDHYFAHRTRALEGKDGNPLNEVRMLCTSLLQHGGVLTPEKSIKYQAGDSVLGLQVGEPIRLDAKSFQKLFRAYFKEIRARFA